MKFLEFECFPKCPKDARQIVRTPNTQVLLWSCGEGPWPPCSASLLLSIGQCRHLAVLFEIVWDSWHQGFMVFLTHPTFGKEEPNNGLMIFGLVFTLRRRPGLSALYRIINAIKENIYHRKLNDYRQITYLFEAQCSYKLSLAKLSFEPI